MSTFQEIATNRWRSNWHELRRKPKAAPASPPAEVEAPSLFDMPEPLEDTDSIQARFERFDAENPEVYKTLVILMHEMKMKGIQRWSVKAAFEVLRYQTITTGGDDFKLPNDYTSRYARKLLQEFPQLEGFIEIRELKSQ
jgi:hypothetical protein